MEIDFWEVIGNLMVFVVLVGLFYALIIITQSKGVQAQNTADILAIRNDMADVNTFTKRLDSSPQFRGVVGEDVVRTLLAGLPLGSVEEQVMGSKIPGRPDFVVSLPNVAEKLVLDAKMTIPVEGIKDNKFRIMLLNRAKEIMKYIVPGYTFDFVLMWIPDSAYERINNDVAQKLYDYGVVPVTTPTMLGMIHLLRRAHQAFKLNSMTSDFLTFQGKLQTAFKLYSKDYTKGYMQLVNALKNMDKAGQTAIDIEEMIENFNTE